MQSSNDTNIKGRMNRKSEMPDDLIATNSKLSPKLPNVMIDEIKIAMGMAKVRNVAPANSTNFPMIISSRSFPTKSSIYFHKFCIINTKNVMKNVATNGPINARIMRRSSFLNMRGIRKIQ